jgi:hypothetical protein
MDTASLPAGTRRSASKLIDEALAALQQKTGITSAGLVASGQDAADASVDLIHASGTASYLVECKSVLDRKAQADQIRRKLDANGRLGLFVAPYVSKELAEYCRVNGLQFIDTHGNAYLRAHGLFVFITGEKSALGQTNVRPPKGLTTAAGLRVVFALLCKPDFINAPLKDIAGAAGVALGTAYNVLEDLSGRGFLINGGGAPRRRLLERRRLMEEWVINYPSTLRTRLHGRRFSAADANWWQNVDLQPLASTWGSEVAASKMIHHLRPASQTIYAPPADVDRVTSALVKQYRLRADQDGSIEILEKFWHWDAADTPGLAPPLLVYADLMALLDPRARETAELIKERYIDATFDQP